MWCLAARRAAHRPTPQTLCSAVPVRHAHRQPLAHAPQRPLAAARLARPCTPRGFLNLSGILGDGGSRPPLRKQFHESVVLPYSADELFDIVADVDRYREFLPYCVDSRVLGPSLRPSRPREADGATYIVDAELTIGFAAIRESYVSEVRYRDGEWVKAEAKPSTLFEELNTEWRFEPYAGGSGSGGTRTRVHYKLNYAFSSPMYAMVVAQVFQTLAGRMMDAFSQRAARTYGVRR